MSYGLLRLFAVLCYVAVVGAHHRVASSHGFVVVCFACVLVLAVEHGEAAALAGAPGVYCLVVRGGVLGAVVGVDVFPAYGVVVEVVGAVEQFLDCGQAMVGLPLAVGVAVVGDSD